MGPDVAVYFGVVCEHVGRRCFLACHLHSRQTAAVLGRFPGVHDDLLVNRRPSRKAAIHFSSFPPMPYPESLVNSRLWGTVSKALA